MAHRNLSKTRIQKEIKELQTDPPDNFIIFFDNLNIHEWYFTLKGSPDSDYEGGFYHGKIILPSNYPLKAPDLMFLTPSGRFETQTKICLSMTNFHPEAWTPLWKVRTMLEALAAFMPVDEQGVGALHYSKSERRKIATASKDYETKFGKLGEHGRMIDEIMERKRQTEREDRAEGEGEGIEEEVDDEELLADRMREEEDKGEKEQEGVSEEQDKGINQEEENVIVEQSEKEETQDGDEDQEDKERAELEESLNSVKKMIQCDDNLEDVFVSFKKLLVNTKQLHRAVESMTYDEVESGDKDATKKDKIGSEIQSFNSSINFLDIIFMLIMVIVVYYMIMNL